VDNSGALVRQALRLLADDRTDDAQRILADLLAADSPPTEDATEAANPGYPPTQSQLVSALKKAISLLNDGKVDEAIKALLPLLGEDYGYPKPKESVTEQSKHTIPIALGEPQKEGRLWDVTLIKAGLSQNGFLYTPELLQGSLHLFENLRCYDSHLTDDEMAKNPVRKVGDLLGWFDNVRWNSERRAVEATFHVAAQWLKDLLLNLHQEHRQDLVGFSIDSFVESSPRALEGQLIRVVDKLVKLNSVDLVTQPAAGGSVDRLVASVQPSPSLEQRLYLIELNEALADSDLPKPARQFLYSQFADHPVPAHRITAAIADQRKLLADLSPGAKVTAAGIIRDVHPVMEVDAFAKDLQALCGWAEPSYKPRFRRLSEWYIALTGDEAFNGTVAPHRVAEANVTTATIANVTADLLNKRLVAEYAPMERWWEPIVSVQSAQVYQELKAIHTYGFSSLATVDQGAPYVEKAWDDTIETGSLTKKGNYVGITLEAIMADDIGAIKRIPGALARAWYHTISDAISEIFTANSGAGPLMADGKNVFHTDHGNLGTADLSFDSLDSAQAAIMFQAEPGSSRHLAIPAKYLLVPVHLRTTGYVIRNSINEPGGNDNDVNPWYQQFEVITVPAWTDSADWAMVADPKQIECIDLFFWQGRDTPELFTADQPNQGSMFTNDELRIKVRGWFGTVVADYRGLYKSNVT